MNFVFLTGRLTRDPEIRYTNSNKAVASFAVAVKDGKDKAIFINCVAWEKAAELLDQYFKKGDGITVYGKLSVRQYEKDGQKRTATEVVVSGIEFPMARKVETYGTEKAPTNAFAEISDDDGELPF